MWIISWLLCMTLSVRKTRKHPTTRPVSLRPILEPLEDRLTPASLVPLSSFSDYPNGYILDGGLVADTTGNLYGVSEYGGAFGYGTVFEVAHDTGALTTLASFNTLSRANPSAPIDDSLVVDGSGNVFGTTNAGGGTTGPGGTSPYGGGTVFEVVKGSGTVTTLACFNGDFPWGGLVEDSSGNLFGTSGAGVFEVAPDKSSPTGYTLTTVASFTGGGGRGDFPPTGLIVDSSGNFFGTSMFGGTQSLGSVFEVAPDKSSPTGYTLTTLASFAGGDNGANPGGGLVEYGGNLFGITLCGTVFEVPAQPNSTITTVVSFPSNSIYVPFFPGSGLAVDEGGNLFGTTLDASGNGTVFEVAHGTGALRTLATDNGGIGTVPVVFVADGNGTLYGTTLIGGTAGHGSVFELSPDTNTITTVASFPNGTGGGYSGLIEDSKGNLFGTTPDGGPTGKGTVFEVAQDSGTITTVATFNDDLSGNGDGAYPYAGLIEDGGNLYGTTSAGGKYDDGTVFEVANSGYDTVFNGAQDSGTISTLWSFTDGTDGAQPYADLVADGKGNLFGTTSSGGTNDGSAGYGTVFEVPESGGSIDSLPFNNINGAYPAAGLVADGGNLFGTTQAGGASGDGTVFEVSESGGSLVGGTINSLSFDRSDGGAYYPRAGLLADGGNLFGTTQAGGVSGDGTVFEVSESGVSQESGTINSLSFNGSGNGAYPDAGLIADGSGNLFGTTSAGGTFGDGPNGYGTVFEVSESSLLQSNGATITTLASFNRSNGANPYAGLVEDGSGNLFGTASGGGTSLSGTVFEVINNIFSHSGLQGAIDGQPLVDPATQNPTITLNDLTQPQTDAFLALFEAPSTHDFTPLTPPPRATTPTDIVVTLDAGVSLKEADLWIPSGIRVQINGGTWLGGSPALTVSSGDLTINGATFVNATDAPTILVTGGNLTLRNDTVEESTGFTAAAIEITGGTVNLGAASDPGNNILNINSAGLFVVNTTPTPVIAADNSFEVDAAPLPAADLGVTANGSIFIKSSLSGIVFEDFNDDGQVDFGERGIANVPITLTGTDFLGNAVNMSALTDSDGAYVFLNLAPGAYTITETQPSGYLQGIDSVGTAGGGVVGTDQFFVQLGQGVNGLNYNYGEQPPAGGAVQKGQTAGIGFWNNKNGQALIKGLPVVTNADGSVTSVANWLAATLPNTFGVNAGSNNLTGKSNADVAALFQQDFLMKGVKLDAQVLATALSVYATNATLDSTGVATQYGFTVSGDGAGTAAVNVGANGDAFGVANATTMTVLDMLRATDAQAISGILYNGNVTRRNEANLVYSAVNQAGDIG